MIVGLDNNGLETINDDFVVERALAQRVS